MPGPTVSARVRSRRTASRQPRRSRRPGSRTANPAPQSTSSTRSLGPRSGQRDRNLVADRQLPVAPPQLERHRLVRSGAVDVDLVPDGHSMAAMRACRRRMPASQRSTSAALRWRCTRHVGVGEQQEVLVPDPLDHHLGDVLRLEHLAGRPHDVAGPAPRHLVRAGQHVGVHAHRAQARDAHALVPVGDGEPLGEGDRGVLRHRVRRVADLRQQPGGRGRRAEVALAPGDPAGHEPAGGVEVGLPVDRPRRAPVGVRRLEVRCPGRRRRWRRRGRSGRRRPRPGRSGPSSRRRCRRCSPARARSPAASRRARRRRQRRRPRRGRRRRPPARPRRGTGGRGPGRSRSLRR